MSRVWLIYTSICFAYNESGAVKRNLQLWLEETVRIQTRLRMAYCSPRTFE